MSPARRNRKSSSTALLHPSTAIVLADVPREPQRRSRATHDEPGAADDGQTSADRTRGGAGFPRPAARKPPAAVVTPEEHLQPALAGCSTAHVLFGYHAKWEVRPPPGKKIFLRGSMHPAIHQR